MTYDAKELEQYPEIMNKEQLRKACHISKRTAHYLLQFNLIPHVCTGKKTRCYAIKKRDVIDFMINREINPSRYIVPTSWYKYGNEDVKPYKIRIQPPLPNDPQKTRRYYESKLAAYLDVIDVAAIVDFTGYNRHTVCEWIRFGNQVYVTSPSLLCVCSSPFTKRLAPSAKVSFSGLVMLAPLSNPMLSPLAIVKSSFKVALPYTYVFVTVSLVPASFHCFVMTELLKEASVNTGF